MNLLAISLVLAGFMLLAVWIFLAWRFGIRDSLDIVRLLLLFVFFVVPYAVLWFFYMGYCAIFNKRPGSGLKPPGFKSGKP
jgi:hypothetical protein